MARVTVNARAATAGKVKITLRYAVGQARARRSKRTALEVTLERRHAAQNFAPVAVFHRMRRVQLFEDRLSEGGVYYYRTRTALPRRRDKISRAVPVFVSQPDKLAEQSPGPTIYPTLDWAALQTGQSECSDDFVSRALVRINEYRAQAGLGPLALDQVLSSAAREHVIWMASAQLLSHEGWFNEVWNRSQAWRHLAQNILNYIRDPAAGVDALMDSPGHRQNILNSGDGHIGIACVIDANGKLWAVQDFGQKS